MTNEKFTAITMSIIEDIESGLIETGGGATIRNRETGEKSFAHDEFITNPDNINKLLAIYEIRTEDLHYVE